MEVNRAQHVTVFIFILTFSWDFGSIPVQEHIVVFVSREACIWELSQILFGLIYLSGGIYSRT